jgi:ADP-ribosylglycohydrolase
MIGAIGGDIIGSVYEGYEIKTTEFPLFQEHSRFTDDTVLTAAVADSILTGAPYEQKLREYYRHYPRAGYGGFFRSWARSAVPTPYHSWGNGSAMRVSPVAFAFDTLDEVLHQAKASAEVTHNHPEGIKGAQAIAAAVFLARSGSNKPEIARFIEEKFGYDLSEPLDSIRAWYAFDVSCQGSVPQAVRAFVESETFEDAVRKAVSIGGDSDTIACMAGAIAHAYYGVPDFIVKKIRLILDKRLNDVVDRFCRRFYCR